MNASSQRPGARVRQALIGLMVLIVIGAATLVLVEGRRYDVPRPTPAAVPSATTATPRPPTGRRWFWDRSLWQNPEPPTP